MESKEDLREKLLELYQQRFQVNLEIDKLNQQLYELTCKEDMEVTHM